VGGPGAIRGGTKTRRRSARKRISSSFFAFGKDQRKSAKDREISLVTPYRKREALEASQKGKQGVSGRIIQPDRYEIKGKGETE
jgi:hypothetical protein